MIRGIDLTKYPANGILVREKDGLMLGKVEVDANTITFVAGPTLHITPETPPIRSFFSERIVKQYLAKDREQNDLKPGSTAEINLTFQRNADGTLNRIEIAHWNTKQRLDELLATLDWSIRRASEKA